jgi:hypothetical protein
MQELALDEIRKIVSYQNTVDIWIAACQENGINWDDTQKYKKFIAYLLENNQKMKKFPLCVKESGGDYERGMDKTKFAEILSESNDENSAVYTIKLDDVTIDLIRKFVF